jgi:hypothetical protein
MGGRDKGNIFFLGGAFCKAKYEIQRRRKAAPQAPLFPFRNSATLQQSSNIFYQKFLKIVSVGGCGEEKGFKGKRNRRSRLRRSLP